MERITHRYADGEAWASIFKVSAVGEAECIGPIIDRLAAYEDTGLEPEEIVKAMSDCADTVSDNQFAIKDIQDLGGIDHLRELVQAEQDGRLAVLPCKIGDTLYDIYDAKLDRIGDVREIKVRDIHVYIDKREKPWLIVDGYYFSLSDFYKTVFLTREEAEAALKE